MISRLPLPSALAAIAVLAVTLVGAAAQERRVPSSTAEVRLSYAAVVQKAAPAVVNVYAARTVTTRNPLFEDPFFRRFFGAPGMPGPNEQQQRSLGSGAIRSPGRARRRPTITSIGGAHRGAGSSLADPRQFEADIHPSGRPAPDPRRAPAARPAAGASRRSSFARFRRAAGRRPGARRSAIPSGVGQTVTLGHRLGRWRASSVGDRRRSQYLHPDRCRDQSRQFRRRAGRHARQRLVGINTAISARRSAADRTASASPFRPIWCGSLSASARRRRQRGSNGPGSARGCRR